MKRVKRRYLALQLDSQETFSSTEFMDAVWSAISELYGEYGASRASVSLIDYNVERKLAIIRTIHTSLEMVRAALASITKINDNPAALHVLLVSGTLRSLHNKMERI